MSNSYAGSAARIWRLTSSDKPVIAAKGGEAKVQQVIIDVKAK